MQVLRRAPQAPKGPPQVLFDTYWVEAGGLPLPDDEVTPGGFVITPSVMAHLRNLARAVLLRRYPILLQVSLLFPCMACWVVMTPRLLVGLTQCTSCVLACFCEYTL